jgi:hypothetical protein
VPRLPRARREAGHQTCIRCISIRLRFALVPFGQASTVITRTRRPITELPSCRPASTTHRCSIMSGFAPIEIVGSVQGAECFAHGIEAIIPNRVRQARCALR